MHLHVQFEWPNKKSYKNIMSQSQSNHLESWIMVKGISIAKFMKLGKKMGVKLQAIYRTTNFSQPSFGVNFSIAGNVG